VKTHLSILLALLMTTTGIRATDAMFHAREVVVHGTTYRYQVFVPSHFDKAKSWPVVLFLHGSGERGDDNRKQLTQGLPPWLRQHADFPAVVVIPQAPEQREWNDPDIAAMAMKSLQDSIAEFHGDRRRLYLTGLSMGGYGSWQLAVDHPGMFASAAIICGGITPPHAMRSLEVRGAPAGVDPFAWVAGKVHTLPVWIFHGGADDVVPPEQSRKMDAALKKRGATVRYTEFPGVGHASWEKAYATDGLWPWMFGHHR
jgi:predicted peptidase